MGGLKKFLHEAHACVVSVCVFSLFLFFLVFFVCFTFPNLAAVIALQY